MLTDFGHQDPFVGICHAVIVRHDPTIRIIDLTHGIERQNVRAGAIALNDSVEFLPGNAVVIAVVDPGVGGDRRAVAVEAANGLIFVGPDNGLLSAALESAGGAVNAVDISESDWRLQPTSNTFHARDIFSPVAAQLATGGSIDAAGRAFAVDQLVSLELPTAQIGDGHITTAVLAVDAYGNARLAAKPDDLDGLALGDRVEIETDDMRRAAVYARSYRDGEPNDPLLLVDSSGWLTVVLNRGDASEALRLTAGKTVRLFSA